MRYRLLNRGMLAVHHCGSSRWFTIRRGEYDSDVVISQEGVMSAVRVLSASQYVDEEKKKMAVVLVVVEVVVVVVGGGGGGDGGGDSGGGGGGGGVVVVVAAVVVVVVAVKSVKMTVDEVNNPPKASKHSDHT
jgi:hypothetical protein